MVYLAENDKNAHVNLILVLIEHLPNYDIFIVSTISLLMNECFPLSNCCTLMQMNFVFFRSFLSHNSQTVQNLYQSLYPSHVIILRTK